MILFIIVLIAPGQRREWLGKPYGPESSFAGGGWETAYFLPQLAAMTAGAVAAIIFNVRSGIFAVLAGTSFAGASMGWFSPVLLRKPESLVFCASIAAFSLSGRLPQMLSPRYRSVDCLKDLKTG